MGMMSSGTRHDVVFTTYRSLGNLLAPRGLTIHDRNLLTDEADLAFLAQLDAVGTVCFNYVKLTLAMSVLVTFPGLLRGVSSLCVRLARIRAFVVKLPQCMFWSPV